MLIRCESASIAFAKVREGREGTKAAMDRCARSRCWLQRGCRCSQIAASARLMGCTAATMAHSAVRSSFALMEARNSLLPREVGICGPAIACGLRHREAAVSVNRVRNWKKAIHEITRNER